MSMENAILAHAAALTALAEAIKSMSGGLTVPVDIQTTVTPAADTPAPTEIKTVSNPEKKTVKGKTEPAADDKADAELDAKAVALAKDKARDNAATDTGAGDEPEAMDYATAKPRLLAVVKKVGKEKVLALIKTYGAEKAEFVDPSKLAALVAEAEALEKD